MDEQVFSLPIKFHLEPGAKEVLDRLHWDAWATEVGRVIDAGEIIPACAHTLQMARFAVSVQLSDYGADTVKRTINAFWVKYGLEGKAEHGNHLESR